jgi:hypothetical protein
MNDGEDMMHKREDDRLDALLSAVRAEPEPRVWARARARLTEGREEPRWVAWLGRPVTLAASAAMLVIALGGSLLLLPAGGASVEATSLTDQLLAERGAASAAELDGTAASATAEAVGDSGGLQ